MPLTDDRASFDVDKIIRKASARPTLCVSARPIWSSTSSTYYAQKAWQRAPSRRSARAKRDTTLRPEILRERDQNRQVYGAKKVWNQLDREGIIRVARWIEERLMGGTGMEVSRDTQFYAPPSSGCDRFSSFSGG